MLNLQVVRDRLGPDFRPFVIRLTNGRALAIPHRDFIAVGRGFAIVLDDNDREYRIDPLHIVSIDDESPASDNGS